MMDDSSAFYNLGDLIDRRRDVDKIAIIDLGGDNSPHEYSFGELDDMANGVARALAARRFDRGERIAILSDNRAEYLAAYYGVMRAGLVAVPVNHRFPDELIAFVIRDADVRLVFCDRERRAHCPPEVPAIEFGARDSSGFDAFVDAGAFVAVVPAPGETAMFLYTSGSTGRPKGVMLSHQSHLWVVNVRLEGQALSRHRYLIAAPLYHMNALALSKLACAAHATIVLLPRFATQSYIEAIGRYRCTWLTAVPPMIAMMLRDTASISRADFSSVEFLRMGSAPVSPSLLAAIAAVMPNTATSNAYGTTEGGPVVFGPHPAGIRQPALSVGYPHARVDLRLVDGDDMNARQGVLELRSPAVMTGYHNRPDLALPFTDDRYYVTGDIFRRDEHGFHYFVGRIDDMFVCGGENIYPGEIEKLLESHPDILQACVVPVDDEIKGQKPVAFCMQRAGASLTADDVKQYALANGPAFAHPRYVWFVDRFPLASTNKIDRRSLIALAQQRVAAASAEHSSS